MKIKIKNGGIFFYLPSLIYMKVFKIDEKEIH